MLKYSKATIEEKFGKKEFKVLFIAPNIKESKITTEHLMLFELETNKDDLKSGLIRVEGRKDFLENEVK